MTFSRAFLCKMATIGVLAAALPVAGCSTRVENTGTYVAPVQGAAAPLPRPARIVVDDFGTDWSGVQLEQGIATRVQRQMSGADPAGEQYRVAQDVQEAITEALIENLQKMGFEVERGSPGAVPREDELLIQGQIVRIDQGNRTRRLAIGFGAGKSDVRAQAQIYYLRPNARPQLLQTYDADVNSGRKPGLAVGGASAAAGGSVAPMVASGLLGVHSEAKKTGVAGEGQRLGNRLAYNLGNFFVQQGWIPKSAVPAYSFR